MSSLGIGMSLAENVGASNERPITKVFRDSRSIPSHRMDGAILRQLHLVRTPLSAAFRLFRGGVIEPPSSNKRSVKAHRHATSSLTRNLEPDQYRRDDAFSQW